MLRYREYFSHFMGRLVDLDANAPTTAAATNVKEGNLQQTGGK